MKNYKMANYYNFNANIIFDVIIVYIYNSKSRLLNYNCLDKNSINLISSRFLNKKALK